MCKDPAFPQGDTESPWRRWNKSAFQNFENNIGRGLFTEENCHLNFLFAVPNFHVHRNPHTAGDEAGPARSSARTRGVRSMER